MRRALALGLFLFLQPYFAWAASPTSTSTSTFEVQCDQAQRGDGTVRILHFGDSHVAAFRGEPPQAQYFQRRFGRGGQGLCLPWIFPVTGLKAKASNGWIKSAKTGSVPRLSLAGGQMEAASPGDWATLEGSFSHVRVHGLTAPGGGKLGIFVDGIPAGTLDLNGPLDGPAAVSLDLGYGRTGQTRRLEIRVVREGRSRIAGVSLDNGKGAVYSSTAFNGARAYWLRDVPESVFRAQIEAEAPGLVILAFGTNEANDADFNPDTYSRFLDGLVSRFQSAARSATILLAGPPDARLPNDDGHKLSGVVAVQRDIAARRGLLFLDQRQTMGGADSILTWLGRGLAARDLIHLTGSGYQILSEAMLRVIFRDPTLRPPVAPPTPVAMPLPPRRPAPAKYKAKSGRIYTLQRKDGVLIITDDPSRYPGMPLYRKDSSE
jgi:lysophospholipase L1-like esterase